MRTGRERRGNSIVSAGRPHSTTLDQEMITIGQRVQLAIDDFGQGRFELALQHAAIAIDITAQRHYQSARSSKLLYKKLLKEYSWLIELMAFGGINLEESKFGNYPIDGNPEPTFQDLIYHVIRCELVHAEGVPENFGFTDTDTITLQKDHLVFPKKLIWGLLAVVVFCPCNSDQRTAEGYWLSIFENRFVINDFWGQETVAKIVYEKRKPIRVGIICPPGHMV